MTLVTDVGLGPGDILLDGDIERGTAPPLLGPRLFWPNGQLSQQLLGSCWTLTSFSEMAVNMIRPPRWRFIFIFFFVAEHFDVYAICDWKCSNDDCVPLSDAIRPLRRRYSFMCPLTALRRRLTEGDHHWNVGRITRGTSHDVRDSEKSGHRVATSYRSPT